MSLKDLPRFCLLFRHSWRVILSSTVARTGQAMTEYVIVLAVLTTPLVMLTLALCLGWFSYFQEVTTWVILP